MKEKNAIYGILAVAFFGLIIFGAIGTSAVLVDSEDTEIPEQVKDEKICDGDGPYGDGELIRDGEGPHGHRGNGGGFRTGPRDGSGNQYAGQRNMGNGRMLRR